MSGRRFAAAVVAALMVTGGVLVPLSLADDGDGNHHHKRHHHKKKKHKRKQQPVATATPMPSGQRASADVTSGGVHITFDARRTEGLPSKSGTGTFRAELPGGPFVAGPVTCLSIVGDDIGLFYPVTDAFPPSIANTGLAVYVTLQTDGHGHATNFGFVPVPTPITDECEPGVAAMAAEGPATATGG